MKIIINKTPGRLYSLLLNLLFVCNVDYFINQMEEQWGMKIEEEIEKDIMDIYHKDGFDLKKARAFFNIDLNIQDFIMDTEFLWSSVSLEDYFNKLRNQSPDIMRRKILKRYLLSSSEAEPNTEDLSNLHTAISILKKQPLDNEIKWSLLCIIEDPKAYIENYILLVNALLPELDKLCKKYDSRLDAFVTWLEEQIKIFGYDYLSQHLELIDLTRFQEVYLSYTHLGLCSSHINVEENRCYLCLGLLFQQYLKEGSTRQGVEQNLMVFKNFSDNTRFNIIKMLAEEESFGQEIAEKLGITTATVSYHMNYLLGASLVRITKNNRKVFYSLNKDRIRKSLLFLEESLDL